MFRFACLALAVPSICSAQEPVTIGGVTYDRVDPGDPFTRRAAPDQDWQPPEPTAGESAAGMLAYVTSDPGNYKPDRVPKPQEHAEALTASLTPGEETAVWVGVSGLADLSGLAATVNTRTAPVSVDIRHEHFWPQRTGWRSREWYITPELLLPCAKGTKTVPTQRGLLEEVPFNLATGETAAFWLTLTARPNAKPGFYRATLRIKAESRPALKVPFEIQLFPFTLERPDDRWWPLYADVRRFETMSDEQVMAELRDFARHGVTGLVEMPLGTADLSELASGQVEFDATPFNDLAEMCNEAGIPGPHVCALGGWPERVRDALGIECNLRAGDWPAEVSAGLEAVARAAVEATKDAPGQWYFYGVDEPHGDNTYAIQDYQAWRRGGAETYATFYSPSFLDVAAQWLTAPCFVAPLVSNAEAALLAREGCEKNGAEFWWYGTGCYVNPFPQESSMFHNRYGAGFFLHKTGARAAVAWTFCRPHEDVFNDFDGSTANRAEPKEQATVYPHFLRPDDWSTYQGAIPTVAWESLREGVTDYAYIHMLQTAIDEARAAGFTEAADEAESRLESIIEEVPWASILGGVAFETHTMVLARRGIAELIMEVREAMGR